MDQARCSSPLYRQSDCQGGNGRRRLRGRGGCKAECMEGPEEEREGNGDYEAESSLTRRGVKGKRKGKGKGKVGRPKKVKVTRAPPPPAFVTPTTPTDPPVNAMLGEEDVTVKMDNTAIPLFQTLQRRTMGRTKRGRALRTGRKTGRRRSDKSGMWTAAGIECFGGGRSGVEGLRG